MISPATAQKAGRALGAVIIGAVVAVASIFAALAIGTWAGLIIYAVRRVNGW